MYQSIKVISILIYVLNFNSVSFAENNHSDSVRVNKCCELNELLVNLRCADANETSEVAWSPIFTGNDGRKNVQVPGFWFAVGIPKCNQKQIWPIYSDSTSRDHLVLLPDGTLRHYIQNIDDHESDTFNGESDKSSIMLHDYAPGQYCMDKAIAIATDQASEFAMVCSPDRESLWTETEFLLRKIVNPICHGISIAILLVVAIIYFVLPSLRDFVGNIITTITCCLIVVQVTNLMRIFTDNFLILDIIVQTSIMTTFFWISSLGYFIWKTFRSRNVFLRITDGKKYCWYSFCVWGCTLISASLGTFAHIFLDINAPKKNFDLNDGESIGILGLLVFFVVNSISIGLGFFFYILTHNYLSNRLNASYGRIHHKLMSNFESFSLLLAVLTSSWMLMLVSLMFDGIFYINLLISAVQAPLILYICVLRQKHVTYLLQKCFCSDQPFTGADWGDEMTYINTAQ